MTGKPIESSAGPNWDDDLAGSDGLRREGPEPRRAHRRRSAAQLLGVERLVFFHLPRTCNHCLNPACVAACPSGAIYKRGEDGVVLLDQEKCRGWRMCVSACPYKKTFYNWRRGSRRSASAATRGSSGARPRPASPRASGASATRACSSTTPTASREAAARPEHELVAAQRDAPPRPGGSRGRRRGAAQRRSPDAMLDAARRSPATGS